MQSKSDDCRVGLTNQLGIEKRLRKHYQVPVPVCDLSRSQFSARSVAAFDDGGERGVVR